MARLGGILAGMGIDVTAELLRRVIDRTPAACEQDHLPLVINHNPRIPDRTAAIIAGGEDPLPHLLDGLDKLLKAGADFIAIPCNTAHHYYDDLQRASRVPVIHMLRETADRCRQRVPGLRKAGLLATTGTVKTGLYQRCFEECGVEVAAPPEALQEVVMRNIMAIKARRDLDGIRAEFAAIASRLADDGAQALIVGCTDISLAVDEGGGPPPIVDSLSVLADAVVRTAQEGNAQ